MIPSHISLPIARESCNTPKSSKAQEETISAANIAVVKRIYEGFDTGDMSKILNSMAEDVSFDHRGADAPDFPINKLFEGKNSVQEFIDTIFGTQEILAHDVHEFFPSGDKVAVVGFFKTRVKATSKEFSTN